MPEAYDGQAMIRFVFRFLGLLCLAVGFIFLVYDGTRSIADQTLYLTSVGLLWSNIHQNSLCCCSRRSSGMWPRGSGKA